MNDINPRAVIGANNPPTLAEQLAITHGPYATQAKDAAADVPMKVPPITSDEEAGDYTEQASVLMDLLEGADKAHKIEKQPWLDGSRAVDNFFSFRTTVKSAADRLRDAIGVWQTAQRQAALKAKAEEEAREREAAAVFGGDEPVTPTRQAPIKAALITSAGGAKAAGSVRWEYEEVDTALIPREFLKVNEAAVRARIAGMKAMGTKIEDAKIPGLRIYEMVKASIR